MKMSPDHRATNRALVLAITLCVLALPGDAAAQNAQSPWLGEWEVPKQQGHRSVTISEVTATGVHGDYDEGTTFTDRFVLFKAHYSPNPAEGFDPIGSRREVFIGFFDKAEVWVGDKYFDPALYGPRKIGVPVPKEILDWAKGVDTGGAPWQTKRVFP
ncbi:MAG: hypothetical protein OEW21_16710 [Betaproteobacteria bacterium]|nr:hypothetical protein [Betaproteobacteria bacterium]